LFINIHENLPQKITHHVLRFRDAFIET
jgi:hypothetical protein